MPRNGDRNSSSFSESIPLGSLSSGRSEHLTVSLPQPSDRQNSDQEGHGDDRSADMDATPPPLGVKLTVYRLVFMTTVLSFGAAKSILTYKGQSIAPTTLDWVSGSFLTVVLYWLGLYEDSIKWKWFFQFDLAPAIGYCAMRAVAEFIWLLFYFGSSPIFASLCLLLIRLFQHMQICYFPHLFPFASVAFTVSTCLCLLLLLIVFRRIARRVIDRELERLVGFVHIYGPGTSRTELYGWSGAVGTIVRFFCGTALFCLPFVVFLMTIPDHC